MDNPDTTCEARRIEINIGVDEDGRIFVDPFYASVRKDDELVWIAPEGVPWAVAFMGRRSPTQALVIQGNGGHALGQHFVNRDHGHFPYSIAVVGSSPVDASGRQTVFLDIYCPEIIIDQF